MAAREMGMLITQAKAEIEKCTVLWYAEHGGPMLVDRPTAIGPEAYVSYHPLGPLLAVMPWNVPYWQAMLAAITILLGGNGYLLKHAPDVMGSVRTGSAIAAQAGAALKKCVPELGSIDPFITLADADLEAAVKAGVAG